MSLKEFANLIQQGKLGKADKQWFPAWLKRFAEFAGSDGRSQIPLTKELALGFSRQLLANGPGRPGRRWRGLSVEDGTSLRRVAIVGGVSAD